MRLNLGDGGIAIEGFDPRDGLRGDCLFPLPDEDGSLDEIRASHVLEHWSHTEVAAVVANWVSKLKPGGLLRIAVPDFEKIARDYLEGKDFNVQGFIFGGHVDGRDRHGCGFDRELLTEMLLACGLERIHEWTSEVEDCARLPVSLNLGGYKPSGAARFCENTVAVLSAPRFGPLFHFRHAFQAFMKARVPYAMCGGAYWHQVLSESMETFIADEGLRYLITCDYDSVFDYETVLELYRLMESLPEADAIVPLQSKRASEYALFCMRDKAGNIRTEVSAETLDRVLIPISSGHFGLTIFRAESLRKFPRPWMNSMPDREGRWGDDKVDADINFWQRFGDAGFKVFLAPGVVVGHLQEVVTWPGKDLRPIFQSTKDYDAGGMPEGARRCPGL